MMDFLSSAQALEVARSRLALPAGVLARSQEHLAQVARRAAGACCPCSPKTLKRVISQCLEGLVESPETFDAQLDELLEAMQSGGDLLELSEVTSGEALPGTWLFLAPPSFAMVNKAEARIFGLAAEELLPLPAPLLPRVKLQGAGRVLNAEPNEDLQKVLGSAGLRELSTNAWLRTPERVSATDLVARHKSNLRAADPSDVGQGYRVFDSSVRGIYVNRWVELNRQTGLFLARRPQAYGADLWAVVEAIDGAATRVGTLPRPGVVHRGCDEGWWLQLAMDALAGRPQEFRLRSGVDGVTVDLTFPLPLWAQRRLEVLGRRTERNNSVASFWLPHSVAQEELRLLDEFFWMKQVTS